MALFPVGADRLFLYKNRSKLSQVKIPMADRLLSSSDMSFMLYDWLKMEGSLEQSGLDRETVDAYFDLSEKLATEQFLNHYKKADHEEPYLDEEGVHVLPEVSAALKSFAELGFFSASFSPDLGGLGLPYLVTSASYAWFAAANVSTSGYAMLTGANARLIAKFGSDTQRDTYALPQIEGRWFGTMCLSEPQAGSGLGDVKTKATHQGSDDMGERYSLVGNKMWISGGDQDISENIVHLVLAKVPNEDGSLPEGTKGISLFIVPKILQDGTRNDVIVAGLNHKMGNRGTSNCLLNFGEKGGATGWMVGEPGQGLRQMFMMMNEARIAVGMGGAALAYRGYLLASDYARERLQGRLIDDNKSGPVPIIEHADVKRMLLSAKCFAEGSMALCLFCGQLVDDSGNDESRALLELLTPVAKTFPSQYGLAANDLAIQVHGGYGYTRDFDVEQLYRDNRLNPIHEGTTGIQAADLLGRKLLFSDGAGLQVLASRFQATVERAQGNSELKNHANKLLQTAEKIQETLKELSKLPPAQALENAAPFLEAFGHVVVAWLWLDQALAATQLTKDDDETVKLKTGKMIACQFFIEYELPQVMHKLDFVSSKNTTIASTPVSIFG